MPELPDVEAYRRRLEKEGVGKRIDHVSVRKQREVDPTPGTLRKHLKGHKIMGTNRHGKWLFARIDGSGDNEEHLVLHFGMTGDLVPYEEDQDGRPKHTVLALDLEGGTSLAYTSRRHLGHIALTKDPEEFAREYDLGPDALSVDEETFLERLGGRTGKLKGAFMDQSLVSGVGNVYADEALFHARIDPRANVQDLEEKDLKRLHAELQRVLKRSVQAGAQPKRMPKSWLVPHRRERDPRCPKCGGSLRREKVTGRTTLWCPRELKE